MCIRAPKPPAPKDPERPEYLRNPYLDAAIGRSGAVNQLRAGRSQLRIDLDSGLGLRSPGETLSLPTSPMPRPVPMAPPPRLQPGLPSLYGNNNNNSQFQILNR